MKIPVRKRFASVTIFSLYDCILTRFKIIIKEPSRRDLRFLNSVVTQMVVNHIFTTASAEPLATDMRFKVSLCLIDNFCALFTCEKCHKVIGVLRLSLHQFCTPWPPCVKDSTWRCGTPCYSLGRLKSPHQTYTLVPRKFCT